MSSRSRLIVTLLGAVAGTILFAWAVHRAGVPEIVEGIRRVGWGLLVILALAGLRFLVRAECWRLCMPSSTPLSRRQAWSAFVAGDAVGSVTPLGLLASEPTKVVLTRHHLAPREAVASLALENLVYAASVVVMVGLGLIVLLTTVPLPAWWGGALAGAFVAALAGGLVLLRLMRGTWDETRGSRPPWRSRLSAVRVAVLGFSAAHRGRLARVFVLDLAFHALAVLEILVTLQWLLGDRSATLQQAIIFEALNRVVTVTFKFVPFRIGVDEASSGALAPLLAMDPAAGVALAVLRKIRNLFWAGIGMAVVVAHPATPAGAPAVPATDRPENLPAHRP